MFARRTNPFAPTIAQLHAQWQGGKHLASLGVVAARRPDKGLDAAEVILADGSGVHMDRIQARCAGAILALADLCEVHEQAAAF